MMVTVDSAGRVMIPKAIREATGIKPGTKVDVSDNGGTVALVPGGRTAQLVTDKDGNLVISGNYTLDDHMMFSAIDEARQWPRV